MWQHTPTTLDENIYIKLIPQFIDCQRMLHEFRLMKGVFLREYFPVRKTGYMHRDPSQTIPI